MGAVLVRPAGWPRSDARDERMLAVDAAGGLRDLRVGDLPALLHEGDVLVVNDAATLPAALPAATADGRAFEVRLWQPLEDGAFAALLLGAGDARQRTEQRPPPPRLAPTERIVLGDLGATVRDIDPRSPRLVRLAFDLDGVALLRALHRLGRPIQYAYVERPYSPWHVQTQFATQPVAAEMPSAGRPLCWGTLLELRRRGITVVGLTHAAGISSTGDPELDARLPWPERWWIPESTAAAVQAARRRSRRVVAVGTTVVRALEGAADADGAVRSGQGITSLVLSAGRPARVVTSVLTGMHEPGESHYALLLAIAPRGVLERASAHAEAEGYLAHEMGDSMFVDACVAERISTTAAGSSPSISTSAVSCGASASARDGRRAGAGHRSRERR